MKPVWLWFALVTSLVAGCANGPLKAGGPHAIGTRTWVATHPSELVDPIPPDDGGPRRVPVQAWYPAAGEAGALVEDARFDAADAPVFLFHHGGGAPRLAHESLFVDLASRGYVVLAADHPGVGMEAKLDDGSTRGIHPKWQEAMKSGDTLITAAEPIFLEVLPLLQQDLTLILETAQTKLPGLSLERVAFGGHSLGGAVALHACREDPRCDVFIDLDGPPLGDQQGKDEDGRAILVPRSLDKPTLVVSTGVMAKKVPGAKGAWDALDALARAGEGPVLQWHLEAAGHMDVTDLPLAIPPFIARLLFGESSIGDGDPVRTVGATNAVTRAFLERYLRCDASVDPRAAGEAWPELELRHAHEDRRGELAPLCASEG